MNKSLVSIIIPIYNSSKWLTQCLDSVINQSYCNLEIILIDDGSTDESGEICDNYSIKDSRIKVIHKNNEGVSTARNKGLSISLGEYICFVDSDDIINLDMIKTLMDLAQARQADMVMCSYARLKEGKQHWSVNNYNEPVAEGFFNRKEALKNILSFNGFQGFIWNKLIKRELFVSEPIVEFSPDIYICEDLLVLCKLIDKAFTIVYTNKKLYGYVIHPNSVVNQISSKSFTCFKAKKMMFPIYEKYGLMDAKSNYVFTIVFFLSYYFESEIKKRRKWLINELKRHKGWFDKSVHNYKDIILFRLILVSPSLFGILLGGIKKIKSIKQKGK